MNRISRIVLPALLGASLLSVGPNKAQTETREFDAAPGERLTVDLKTGGSITIRGGGSGVRVEATVKDDVALQIERVDSGVLVTSSYRGDRRSNRGGVDLVIEVPERFDIRLSSLGGDITIEGVDGTIDGETMGGELTLSDLRGELDLTTMGGDVILRDSEVDGSVSTMGGDVRVENVRGNVEATTMGGKVTYDNVESGGAAGACSELRITTMGGSIKAPDAECGANLETMGGNISIGRVAENLQAETMGGDVTVEELDGWARISTMGGNITVTMVGTSGRRDMSLISMGGTIELAVPEDLSMAIDITLAYTKQSRQKYEIESDFDLDIRRTENWSYEDGDPRKYIYGSASLNGGEHRIKIETMNGDVRLVRGR